MEEWVDLSEVIEGLEENYYYVSNKGNVKSVARVILRSNGKKLAIKERVLSPYQKKEGYLEVKISINNIKKAYYVHRLVAFAFLKKESNTLEVNHKNGIKTDNNLENLEWVTSSENKSHAFSTGLRSYKYSPEFKQTIIKRYLDKEGSTFTEISKEFEPCAASIRAWINEAVPKKYSPKFKENITTKYLRGEGTLEDLSLEYGPSIATIARWVNKVKNQGTESES